MSLPTAQHGFETAAPLQDGHLVHGPELHIRRRFNCLGFAIDLATNHPEVEIAAAESWSTAPAIFAEEPIHIAVTVVENGDTICPPAPVFRSLGHVGMHIADSSNVLLSDMETGSSQICISTAALMSRAYLRYFFLEAAALTMISTRYCVPIHAACVSMHDHGVLLCGESAAGKSSFAYACARAGWRYTSDDASYLLLRQSPSTIVGNCNQFRFRPGARELFPELRHCEITPRAAGKPSMEVPVARLNGIKTQPRTSVALLVFLDRVAYGPPAILPLPSGHARSFIRQHWTGMREPQHAAVDRLLREAPVIRLTYSLFGDAIHHLEQYLHSLH